MRQTFCSQEIMYYFKEYIQKATEVMLWQKGEEKRQIWTGRFLFFNQRSGKAIVVLKDFDDSLKANLKSTLYIKGEFESVVFKTEIKEVAENSFEISIPESIFLYEKRKFERHSFKEKEPKVVSFSKHTEFETARNLLNGNVLDMSRQGLTLIMQPNQAQNWSPKDCLNIYRISDKLLTQPIKAEIVYIKPIRKIANNRMYLRYRFGLRFKNEMNRIQITTMAASNGIKVA